MPNIVLTTYCNRKCPYCFASVAMPSLETKDMPFREVITIADMAIASGARHISVLGGEPTLHPQFLEVAQYLLERRLEVTVFTNALCSEKLIHDIGKIAQLPRIKFVVNVNHPDIDDHMARQELFLKGLPNNCDISYNVCVTEGTLDFLVDLIERTGLENHRIRVSLAQPTAERSNRFVEPAAFSGIVENLVNLAEAVMPKGTRMSLDCGWPLCIFSDEALGRLRRANADTKFVCETAVDIGPGREAWSCYPLIALTKRTFEVNTTLRDLTDGFVQENRRLRGEGEALRGMFPACSTCVYLKQKICAGGCLSRVLDDQPSVAEVVA